MQGCCPANSANPIKPAKPGNYATSATSANSTNPDSHPLHTEVVLEPPGHVTQGARPHHINLTALDKYDKPFFILYLLYF